MMRKKSKSRARRHEANRRVRDWQHARFWSQQPLPALRMDPTDGDPDFVREVGRLIAAYDLSEETCREGVEVDCYQALRHYGADGLHAQLQYLLDDGTRSAAEVDAMVFGELMRVLTAPGQWLFARLPERFTQGDLVKYFFYVTFDGKEYVVRFNAMKSAMTAGGTVYLPPGAHQVRMAGRMWEVAFHKHAMERVCLRLRTTRRPTYFQYCVLWAELSGKTWSYEPLDLPNGQQGIRLLTHMTTAPDPSRWHDIYIRQILGVDKAPIRTSSVSIVLGYMPVAVTGRYARAITFLYPGYNNTPERQLIDRLPPGDANRQRLMALVDHANYHEVMSGDAMEAIRWFHLNGVPQVRIEQEQG